MTTATDLARAVRAGDLDPVSVAKDAVATGVPIAVKEVTAVAG
jgi:hypothetical protein